MTDTPPPPDSAPASADPAPPTPPSQRWGWRPRLRWFAAEIVVVVCGILIALALNAWWASLQETRQQEALLAAVADELAANMKSLDASTERHRAILEAIDEAARSGSSEAVHMTAVIERELWEPQTAALEMLMSFQSRSSRADPEFRIRLGKILELVRKYQERGLRAAAFQDRARERIAELGLPIYGIMEQSESHSIFRDQVMLNYLTLRWSEEAAAIEAAEPLAARMVEALKGRPER